MYGLFIILTIIKDNFYFNLLRTTSIIPNNQIGIGIANPSVYAALDLTSAGNNQGLLLPTLSSTAIASIAGPANGLIMYNTTIHKIQINRNGTWNTIASNSPVSALSGTAPNAPSITIAGSDYQPTALLNIKSTGNKGFLIPTQTNGMMNNISGSVGVIYYELSTNNLMYYNGSGWQITPLTSHTFSTAGGTSTEGGLGIGTTPHISANLHISNSSKGVRLPLLTTTQRNAIASPAEGLLIFNTTTNRMNICTGSNWEAVQ